MIMKNRKYIPKSRTLGVKLFFLMPEFRGKVSSASAFLPLVNCVIPAWAFRHQGQPGAACDGLVGHCPAMHVRASDSNDLFLKVTSG
jgi:hypothetical protein